MKSWDGTRIHGAEIAQLIILEGLFADKRSREVIFQGGTALRWFYGGVRFSEDLDFVTPLSPKAVGELIRASSPRIRRLMTANFGSGAFRLKPATSRDFSHKVFVEFLPDTRRGKLKVKVEFEQLAKGKAPRADRVMLQSSPAVAFMLREAGYRTAGASVIVNVETAQEILTDKMRALMERPFTKGRDWFDIWFLDRSLQLRPDPEVFQEKLSLYATPFTARKPPEYYARLDLLDERDRQALIRDIHRDLTRFLDPPTVATLESNGYRDVIEAVSRLFSRVLQEPRRPSGLPEPPGGRK